MNDPLYVIAVVSNPIRYQIRYKLCMETIPYFEQCGAIPYLVELQHGDRPFMVTSSDNPRHIQLRTNQELWHKENMINIGVSRLPYDAKNIAIIDADVRFSRPDWVNETVQQLKHYKVVQMFSFAQDLGPTYEPMMLHYGYCYYQLTNQAQMKILLPGRCGEPHEMISKDGKQTGHPGYAWAMTRETFNRIGGMPEHAILGSGDTYLARALLGNIDLCFYNGMHPEYKKLLFKYQERIEKYVKRNIGYVPGTLYHYWHGKKSNRGYTWRTQILSKHNYNPIIDLYKDAYGLVCLDDDKIGLRDDIMMYFRSRSEDDISVT